MTTKTMNALWNLYNARRVQGKKSAKETTRVYERYIQPRLGEADVASITFEHLDAIHNDMKDTPYQANRMIGLLRPMFKYGQALKWIAGDYNPAVYVVAYTERKRQRHMKPREAPRIAQCITDKEPYAPRAALYLWLLIFTGARGKELRSAKWKNLSGNTIRLNEHKTASSTGYDRIIILPPAAMEKLEKLVPKGERHPEDHIINLAAPHYIWRTVRVDAKCDDLRIHDLRHTFGTYAMDNGFTLDQIGEALNHTNPQTTKIYAELTHRARNKISLDVSVAMLADMQVIDRELIENDPLA